VEDLQRDRSALGVDGVGDLAVPHRVQTGGHLGGERLEPAAPIGRVAAGDDQAGAAAGPLGEVGGELGQVEPAVLQPGVHRAHHHPVAQRDGVRARSQRERGEQVREGAGLLGHGRDATHG